MNLNRHSHSNKFVSKSDDLYKYVKKQLFNFEISDTCLAIKGLNIKLSNFKKDFERTFKDVYFNIVNLIYKK